MKLFRMQSLQIPIISGAVVDFFLEACFFYRLEFAPGVCAHGGVSHCSFAHLPPLLCLEKKRYQGNVGGFEHSAAVWDSSIVATGNIIIVCPQCFILE